MHSKRKYKVTLKVITRQKITNNLFDLSEKIFPDCKHPSFNNLGKM